MDVHRVSASRGELDLDDQPPPSTFFGGLEGRRHVSDRRVADPAWTAGWGHVRSSQFRFHRIDRSGERVCYLDYAVVMRILTASWANKGWVTSSTCLHVLGK